MRPTVRREERWLSAAARSHWGEGTEVRKEHCASGSESERGTLPREKEREGKEGRRAREKERKDEWTRLTTSRAGQREEQRGWGGTAKVRSRGENGVLTDGFIHD
eukprot:3941870-Rhodomonas_salina.1